MPLVDLPLVLLDHLRLWNTRRRGVGCFRSPETYFGDARGPDDPDLVTELDRINDDLARYLEPGHVEAPDPDAVRCDGPFLSFPSPRPTGSPPLDRVTLKIYPEPEGGPRVGVLFHHWVYLEQWWHVDFLLRPLIGRCRLAAMLGPHHLARRRPGWRPAEGLINPNPLHLFAGLRQWQADHAATLALLSRDHGFERTVVLGYSIGGFAALYSFLFSDPLPLVAVCVTNNYARGVFEGSATAHLREALGECGFDRERFTRAVRTLHLARLGLNLDGRRLTWIRAREDRIEPSESLMEPVRALRPRREVVLPGAHSTAPFFRRRIAREVLAQVAEAGEELAAGR